MMVSIVWVKVTFESHHLFLRKEKQPNCNCITDSRNAGYTKSSGDTQRRIRGILDYLLALRT